MRGPDDPAEADPAPVPVPMPQPLKGRGTPFNIAHRFESRARESHDDGWGTLDQLASDSNDAPATEIIEEHTTKSILAANDSPDVPFELSINPYRGCEHVITRRPVCD